MRMPEPPRRDQGENVIPLINIVFLLLIFFMLAGTLTRPDLFNVEPPETVRGIETDLPEEGVILMDANGRLAFEEEELALEALGPRLEQWLADDPERPLVLKADAGVPAHRLMDVMDVLRAAGADRLTLLTNPAER
ncbi:MAG: biopolymer transporter ExbD [Ectothiorhodospiraceae bacterium]|nr:biopolymer transporter ExbD [Ectothiorhodospiraceae bacterium]MCH8503359.1 biopolymer transporter ExbD [Ectothiorhodospiraceae bacterium]